MIAVLAVVALALALFTGLGGCCPRDDRPKRPPSPRSDLSTVLAGLSTPADKKKGKKGGRKGAPGPKQPTKQELQALQVASISKLVLGAASAQHESINKRYVANAAAANAATAAMSGPRPAALVVSPLAATLPVKVVVKEDGHKSAFSAVTHTEAPAAAPSRKKKPAASKKRKLKRVPTGMIPAAVAKAVTSLGLEGGSDDEEGTQVPAGEAPNGMKFKATVDDSAGLRKPKAKKRSKSKAASQSSLDV